MVPIKRLARSMPVSGSLLQKKYILISWRSEIILNLPVFNKRWHSARIAPLPDFGVAVRIGKAACTAVVEGGQIVKTIQGGLVRVTSHVRRGIADVNTVLAHVKKHKGLAWPGHRHI